MDMLKVTARWTGFTGAPGYSNFFFAGGGGLVSDAQQVADRVRQAFARIDSLLPTGVQIRIEPDVPIVASETGVIVGFNNVDPDVPISGTGTGGYSSPTGAVVTWRTSDLRNGRRIRGRTFLVPLSGTSYQPDGTLTPGAITGLNSFADHLISFDFDSEFGVWSRPVNGSGGVFATVDSATIPDMAAVLRSRRD